MKFYGLHQHSHYSVLDGLSTVDSLIEYAKDNKVSSLALTEHGTLSSAYELWDKCSKNDIKPVLGIEGYFVDDTNSEEGLLPYSYSHIVLLCQNETGWNNLKKIHWMSCKAFLKKPRIDYSMLKGNTDGLICSTACTGGLIGAIVNENKYYELLSDEERNTKLNQRIRKFAELFPDRFYLEIMFNELKEQRVLNKYVLKLSTKYKLPVLLTNDSHYTYADDDMLHDVIKCVQFKSLLSQPDNGTYSIHNLYNVNYQEVKVARRKHKYVPFEVFKEAVKNTQKIIGSVEKYHIRPPASALPRFSDDSEKMLSDLCEKGKKKLFKDKFDSVYQKRLEKELSVIYKLGMADYFLIVWDIAREARERDIPFNTRGSVGGSIVAYLIGISWIDPIKFDTMFERFLTEDRLSLPDIDMDFGKMRRGEMIDYLRSKYGEDSIAHIVNFSRFKPRGAIKDVSRVYGLSFGEVNKVTALIPDGTEVWDDIPDIAEVNKFIENNSEVVEEAKHLTGVIRHRGVHASGIVLTPGNILDWVPVSWANIGGDVDVSDKVTEFDMYALEDMNILKLDFLGQNTLDIIKRTLEIIDSDIKTFDQLMAHILNNLEDSKVYKYICSGDLIGTFQLGTSEGMRTLIKEVKPKNIFDIVDCIALYRSAVLAVGAHTKYVARKFGREAITYYHPKMAQVLDKTKGILLFQESTMQLAVLLAGFTPTDSDHFRKGIKQKDKEKFEKWHAQFIEGCKKYSNIEKKIAEQIWHEIEVWSGYGFCRAHSNSYSLIAYTTAWLKYYYPNEFMTALLSFNSGDDDKLSTYIKESKRLGLKLIRPDVNKSNKDFILKGQNIIYPFTVIKKLGDKAIDTILKTRKKGRFKSFEDFYDRTKSTSVNIGVITNMIFAGCFRKFGTIDQVYERFMSKHSIKDTVKVLYCKDCRYNYPVTISKKKMSESGAVCPECGSVDVVTEYSLIKSKKFNINYCKNIVYGFAVDDIMKPYLGDIISRNAVLVRDIGEYAGDDVAVAGFVSKIKKHIDKNGNEMAFLTLSDGQASVDIVVFASIWGQLEEEVKKNSAYIMRGRYNDSIILKQGGLSKLILKKNG